MTTQEKRYTLPNNLGGAFTVVIVETDKDDADRVKIRCTTRGWTNYSYWTTRQQLIEIKGA